MEGLPSVVAPIETPLPPIGERGEKLAAEFLHGHGYRIVLTNFKVPIGRNSKGVAVTGEIDVIAIDVDTLCFVEVKTRRSEDFSPIIAAVDSRKQRQIIRTAKIYRRLFHIRDVNCRYDVVTVLMPGDGEPVIELTKAFWTEGKFRKKRWYDPAYRES